MKPLELEDQFVKNLYKIALLLMVFAKLFQRINVNLSIQKKIVSIIYIITVFMIKDNVIHKIYKLNVINTI